MIIQSLLLFDYLYKNKYDKLHSCCLLINILKVLSCTIASLTIKSKYVNNEHV